MYSTCIFCNSSLGANEVIEAFPVGRRLAFDPAKGRLWVVCRKCERWNLTPLEQRWEAFEECERRFRATRTRMSTDQIGLARLSEGLELVRIGEPLRPEFAAWRYGDQFGRRRRKAILYTGVVTGIAIAAQVGTFLVGAGAGIGFLQMLQFANRVPVRTRLRSPEGKILKLRDPHVMGSRLTRDPQDSSWVLKIRYKRKDEILRGDEAVRAASLLLPTVNRMHGSRAQIRDAIRTIENARSAQNYVDHITKKLTTVQYYDSAMLGARTPVESLALEMALHEDQERRALENELHLLEAAWRDAEEIAAIADNMFVPTEHEDFIDRNRSRNPPTSNEGTTAEFAPRETGS